MIVVNLTGLALIALIVWWFWLYRPPQATLDETGLLIRVENGVYQPSHIKVPANKPFILQFLRQDASPCAEMLLIPDLQLSETLPLKKTKEIQMPALQPGQYAFHCQMQMYRGQLVVE